MNEAPKGKIGRLPKPIQEQVNRRLEHGESHISRAVRPAHSGDFAPCQAGQLGLLTTLP